MVVQKKTQKKETAKAEIEIVEIKRGRVEFCVLGTTPLILNRMSRKSATELLLPRKKSAAEKASTLKHIPMLEYQASFYRSLNGDAPTRIQILATSFKNAMRDAALDMPDSGTSKAQIGRLTYVEGDYVSIYGIPKLFMNITRMADQKRTPDVRTRAIIPNWACKVAITFTRPILRDKAVVNLLANAGVIQGVGDWRQGKGNGNYGLFEIVPSSDKRFKEIITTGGRVAQDKAIETPECYDAESFELLDWYKCEVDRRGFTELGETIKS